MKLTISIPGTFRRVLDSESGQKVPIEVLMQEVVGAAQKNFDGWTRRIGRDYGLDLMLESTLKDVLLATVRTKDGATPFLSLAEGRIRRDRQFEAGGLEVTGAFRHEFQTSSPLLPAGIICLSPADPRLPRSWTLSGTSEGVLTLTLEEGLCLENPELNLGQVWEMAVARRQALTTADGLDALDAWVEPEATLRIPLGNAGFLSIEPSELSESVRLVRGLLLAGDSAAFRHALEDARARSAWTAECEAWLSKRARRLRRPDWLEALGASALQALPLADVPTRAKALQPILARGETERHLRDIILGAREYLFIGSHIIEDLALATLVARKAEQLPGRVWVLCNLKATFLDVLPALLDAKEATGRLAETDRRKLDCLRVLLASPALVRHGDVHLKAYASERAGYLGSANLTRNSLRHNWESGVILDEERDLRALLRALRSEWAHARTRVTWPEVGDGLVLESRAERERPLSEVSMPFMTSARYRQELLADLKQARFEVRGLTYSIRADSPLLVAGAPGLRRVIGADARMAIRHPNVRPIPFCHAKVVVIDGRVAYLGGENAPSGEAGGLRDLMIRTEDPVVVARLSGEMACLF